MSSYPLYTNDTTAQILTQIGQAMIITPSGTDMFTGVQILTGTTAQILEQCIQVAIISPSGTWEA